MPQKEIAPWIAEIPTKMAPPARPSKPGSKAESKPFYQFCENDLLGHGGMGAVFLATLQPLGVLRALKILRIPEPASVDEVNSAKDRFLLEASIMGNLRHPAAVKALDYQPFYEEKDGKPANRPTYLTYAMEPCLVQEGELRRICAAFQVPCTAELNEERKKRNGAVSLQTFLTADYAFPERIVARFARELIAVLRSAHEQEFKIGDEHVKGIVHRDVKPSNILVGADGRLRLTDFGISKPADSLPTTGTGTGGYAAPEQWENVPVRKEADYYSLGVVLYQLLTRTLPPKPWKDPSSFAQEGVSISRHWDILLRGMLRDDREQRLGDPDLLDYEFSEIEAGRGMMKPIIFRKEHEEHRAQSKESWPVASKKMVELGKSLEKIDPTAAFGLYAAAADSKEGEYEGAFLAGKDYFYGIAHGIDAAKAEHFLKLATNPAAPDSIRADANDYLGLLAQQQKKSKAANGYFKRAKNAGSLDAFDSLGLIDWQKAEECTEEAKKKKYYQKAFNSFSRADQEALEKIARADSDEQRRIDADVAWARLHLARCLFQGKGVGKDPERAKNLLEKVEKVAEAVKDIHLQKDIGDQYWHGEATDKDKSAAEKWYQLSAEKGCLDAQVALAKLLLSKGEDAQKDKKDAWTWLGKACARGFSDAFRVRAECYVQGKGVSADLSRAVAEYRRATECSGPGQDDWIEEAYCKGRFGWPGKDVLAWIRARAETGAIWALRLCVGILREENPSLADDFLVSAAQKGIASAQFELARQCLFCNQQTQARKWFNAFLRNPEDKDAYATAFAKTWLGRIPHG